MTFTNKICQVHLNLAENKLISDCPNLDSEMFASQNGESNFAPQNGQAKILTSLYQDITFLILFLPTDTIQGLSLATALYPLSPYHPFCPHYHNNKSYCHNHTSSYICNYYNPVFCSYFVILYFHYITLIFAICLLPLPYLPESL